MFCLKVLLLNVSKPSFHNYSILNLLRTKNGYGVVSNFLTLFYNFYFNISIKVCQRKNQNNECNNLLLINYTFEKQSLMNTNPYSEEFTVFPGKYLILPILKTDSGQKKKFSMRLAVILNSIISIDEYVWSKKSNTIYMDLSKSNISIKLIVSKCCACDEFLSDLYMISKSNVFCLPCYNSIFRCTQCDLEIGNDYFTIENKLICLKCTELFS